MTSKGVGTLLKFTKPKFILNWASPCQIAIQKAIDVKARHSFSNALDMISTAEKFNQNVIWLLGFVWAKLLIYYLLLIR